MNSPFRSPAAPASGVRRLHALAFLLVLVALVAGAPARVVGDGGEYLVMALNLSELSPPWLSPTSIERRERDISEVPAIAEWPMASATTAGRLGRRDFIHFWMYPALAAPFVAACRLLDVAPLHGFMVLNVLLLGGAFWLTLPTLGTWATWALFAGPVLWWADKAHTEVFTFVLLLAAVLCVERRPGWAMAAAGLGATQNPPILVVLPAVVVALAAIKGVRSVMRSRGVWIGAAAGLLIFSVHPIYYLVQHGTPSLLMRAADGTMPRLLQWLAVPFDSNIGLVVYFPGLVLLTLLGLAQGVRTPSRLARPDVLLAVLVAPVFLFSFAQTGNVHHGGTPGMSRYAVWLIPLCVPFVRIWIDAGNGWKATVTGAIAVPSVVGSLFFFHPRLTDNVLQPTWVAQFLWTRHPGVRNPLPEIFAEVVAREEEPRLPLSTGACEKVLLVGRGDSGGAWPIPCYPAPVPQMCRVPGALCYANRTAGGGYAFVDMSAFGQGRFRYSSAEVWPAAVENHVRKVMDDVGWWTLQPGESAALNVLRAMSAIGAAWPFQSESHVLIVFAGLRPGASVGLRPPSPMEGAFVDPMTGDSIEAVAFDGEAGSYWQLLVPASRDLVLLALKRTAPR